jgi:hypothetical protein
MHLNIIDYPTSLIFLIPAVVMGFGACGYIFLFGWVEPGYLERRRERRNQT